LFQGLTKVLSQVEVRPGIHLLQINCAEIAGISSPGQFVMISCGMDSGRLLRRPISINRVVENRVDFLFAQIGAGTNWLAQRKAGDLIDILGPLGNGFSIRPETRNLLLVAGGMGIAPLCFLAERVDSSQSVTMLIGAKTSSLVLPEEYLPECVNQIIATEDGSKGKKGMVTSLIPEQAGLADQIFVCGPLQMYQAINNKYLSWFKEKPVQVSLEVRMGCGLGFCYACTIKTYQGLKQVCKDGPIFNLEDVIWNEMK
jgi:dihydroorotate dehydrogenase electron transfer subunit